MVTAYELKLNNLVLNPNDNSINIITVENISDIQNGYLKREPILLTEELLESFGFEKRDIGYKHPNINHQLPRFITSKFMSEEKLESPFLRFDGLVDVYYVHDLQNLYYALTKTELDCKIK